MTEELKKTLQDYFIDYKQFSKEFSIDDKLNDYGVVFTEKELETAKNNINKILLNIKENYDFVKENNELPSDIHYSKNSLILNNPLLENESSKIYKDYILRLNKNKNNNNFIEEVTETENNSKYDDNKISENDFKDENKKLPKNLQKDKNFVSKYIDKKNFKESYNYKYSDNKNKSNGKTNKNNFLDQKIKYEENSNVNDV